MSSRWGAIIAEKYPLNLNQIMLAEEARDGKWINPFLPFFS